MNSKRRLIHVFRLCLAVGLLFISADICAQSDSLQVDTTRQTTRIKEKKGSIFSGRPGQAMLFSLLYPGAGQFSNKSYLRVPFVWAAVGGMGYLLNEQVNTYECYRDAYKDNVDGIPHTPHDDCDDLIPTYSREGLKLRRDQANVNRQWAIVGFTLVWLANGVDAFVDAHLKDFDIDEDLSIDIGPVIDEDPYAPMRMGIFVKF